MKRIILDTNVLMAIGEFHIDIFTELDQSLDFKYEIQILSGTLLELNKIIEGQRGKYKSAAKLALSILKTKNVQIIPSEEDNVDNELANYSKKGYLILTQDVALKKRLTKPYLTIRQKKKVSIIK